MRIRPIRDTLQKLDQGIQMTTFEPAGDSPQREKGALPRRKGVPACIAHVATPRGPMPVMKTMLTTACERDCFYCPFRAGRSQTRRMTFKPEELARAFDQLQRRKLVDGLFLSSGIIKGGVATQDRIIQTAEIIRQRYDYRGYIHLKIMPGAERAQIYRSMQLADRVSINLEGPTAERLQALAPKKEFYDEMLGRLLWAGELRREKEERLASIATQFVVGAVGDTDLELLSISDRLLRQVGLSRTYYSAFHPIAHTPLENTPPTPPRREFRLYQSSFLLRDYHWDVEELPFRQDGNLPLNIDPKRAWAEANLRHAPIELMKAERRQLLRVPAIGPRAVEAILSARRQRRLTDLAQLRGLGVRAPERSAPFIMLDGRRPPQQERLFA